MLIKYTKPLSGDTSYNKVGAIKAIRAFNRMGLKESKEAIETVVECGQHTVPEGDGNIYDLRASLAAAGPFTVVASELELITGIEKCIQLAIDIRDYKCARSLINTLPSKLRAGRNFPTE